MSRIYLSPPDVGPAEVEFVLEAFEANWVAPVGPHLDAFEQEFAALVGSPHAVALSNFKGGACGRDLRKNGINNAHACPATSFAQR